MARAAETRPVGIKPRRLHALWQRYIRGPIHEYRWPILFVLAVTTLGLGVWGFSLSDPDLPFPERLYRALQLFVLESGSVESAIPWQLEVARWTAWFVAVGAAVGAFLAVFRDQVGRLRVRFARNHVVICGLGRAGYRLARGFREAGHKVVAVESDGAHPQIDACRRAGITVLIADSRDPGILETAGVHRARVLIVVCGDDATNVDVTMKAHDGTDEERRQPLQAYAHVVDPRLRQFLRGFALDTPKASAFRLEPFDVSELGASGILAEHPPFDERGRTPLGPPNLLVVGLGQTGSRLILDAAQLWIQSREQDRSRIPVTVIDRAASDLWAGLRFRYPWLPDACDVTPLTVDVDSPRFLSVDLLPAPDGKPRITTVYVCLDDDVRGLTTALAVRRHVGGRVPIVVRTTQHSALETFPVGLGSSTPDLHVYRMLDRACTPEFLARGMNELMAQAIHDEYLRTTRARGDRPEDNLGMVEWRLLPESLREASRDQAAHIGRKLRAVNCDIVPIADRDGSPGVTFSAAEIELLAKMEHDRWWRERESGGWTHGPQKDAASKRNPFMIPWEALPDVQREMDRNMVRNIPRVLATAGFTIVRTTDDQRGGSPVPPAEPGTGESAAI